jgi:ACR3 family arsenite efflux pump ArsB
VGVLVEVPVMLFLVRTVNDSRGWCERSGVAAEAMN